MRPDEPFDRQHRRPARLSTPARRRSAFLRHFERCRTIVEAATRTGVDRRTVQRWQEAFPAFAARCREIVEARRRRALENVVMAAGHVEVRPIYYRGKRVGEHRRPDRATDLYLLKQADALARREEARRDKADFELRVRREVERRISKMSRSAGHPPTSTGADLRRAPKDLDRLDRDTGLAR